MSGGGVRHIPVEPGRVVLEPPQPVVGERQLFGEPAGVGARLQPDHERGLVAVVGAARHADAR